MTEQFNAVVQYGPVRFNFNDADKVCVATTSENGVWLYGALVGPLPNMPLKGSTAFSIGDLNRDGKWNW